MKKLKKNLRTMLTIFGLAVLILFCPVDGLGILSRAADIDPNSVNLLVAYNAQGERLFTYSAFGVMDDTPFVISGSFSSEVASAYFRSDVGTYEVEFYNQNADMGISMWMLKDSVGDDSAFLDAAYAHENEAAMAVYLYTEGEDLKVGVWNMTLTGWQSNVLICDSYPSGGYYPAPILNAQGQFIGLVADDEYALDLIGNEEVFYSGSGSSGGGSQGGGSQGGGSQGGGSQDGDFQEGGSQGGGSQYSPTPVPTAPPLRDRDDDRKEKDDRKNDDGDLTKYILIGVISGVGVIAVGAIVLVVAKSGKKKAAPQFQSQPVQNTGMVNSPLVYTQPDEIGMTMPVAGSGSISAGNARQESTGEIWLVAKGGYMDGRVYPVKGEVTIGRDVSSVIRYPMDAPGVSRIHAKLYFQEGKLMLMDCSSSSGTFLQRLGKLSPMSPVEVHSGDVLYIGEKINGFEIRR